MKLLNKNNKKNSLDNHIKLEDLEYYNNNALNIYYLYNKVQFLYISLSKVLETLYNLGVDTEKLEEEIININNIIKKDVNEIKDNTLKNDHIIRDIFEKMKEYEKTINKKRKGK